jgi:predicted alpha-1,2-mannosidase
MTKRFVPRPTYAQPAFLRLFMTCCAVLGILAFNRSDAAPAEDLTKYVNVFVGTGGHGHTHPDAAVPFGMVQIGPDTFNEGWDWCSGYHYTDSSIMGFSHTHLSGTGVGDMMDLLVMPMSGELRTEPGTRENPGSGYRSGFMHSKETASPGYYSVLLEDSGIRVELTATERAAFHRYTFAKGDQSHILIDLNHRYMSGSSKVLEAVLNIEGDSLITGFRRVQCWAPNRHIYFAMRFSKPFAGAGILADGRRDTSTRQARGTDLKAWVDYQTVAGEQILVKIGLSGVSVAGAKKNLDEEIPDWGFDGIRGRAHQAWNRELGKIRIDGAGGADREVFYTALYHTMLAPQIFDDVDGNYRGMDGKVHRAAGFHNYGTFSLWDTYRAIHPLYTLIQPERVPGMIQCLIAMTDESPQKTVPIWPLAGNETGCMIGYHAVGVVAEAWLKGFKGLDIEKAYRLMRTQAMMDGYRGLGPYKKLGYVPSDSEAESASKTLEYSYDDWALAQLSKALGKTEDAGLFMSRAANYRNLFDPSVGFIRPKDTNGKWAAPFDPKKTGTSDRWRDFTEANSWQYSWAAQHDPRGFMNLLGGKAKFIEKLDQLFEQSTTVEGEVPVDMTGLIGMYAHGNEPSHHIAYLYNYAGAPWKTASRVREIVRTMYKTGPEGLPGNEDCGQMSAWYLFSVLGFYPVDPVSGNYVIGSPLFPRATIDLGNGKVLSIEAHNVSPTNLYIRSASQNGRLLEKSWISHKEIAAGGKLSFEMDRSPNKSWAASESQVPPSMTR